MASITDEQRKQAEEFIQKQDFRLAHISYTTEPFQGQGLKYDPGTIVQTTALPEIPEGKLSIHLPSIVAMDFNTASKAYNQSNDLKSKLTYHVAPNTPGVYYHDSSVSSSELFDFFESRMQAIIFAYTGLEAFANVLIPSDIKYERKSKRSKEILNKEQTERYVTLDEKLMKVLPRVIGVSTPEKLRSWNTFHRLQKIRDRLVHPKQSDSHGTSQDDDGGFIDTEVIWTELLAEDFPNYVKELEELCRHYYPDPAKAPRWMENPPFWKEEQ